MDSALYTLGLRGSLHGVLEIWVSRKEFCTITVECICAIGSKGPKLELICYSAHVDLRLGQLLENSYKTAAVAKRD
jgi:hypothetical protein